MKRERSGICKVNQEDRPSRRSGFEGSHVDDDSTRSCISRGLCTSKGGDITVSKEEGRINSRQELNEGCVAL
jgi:hypothetical protein